MELKSIIAACAISISSAFLLSPKVTINAPTPGPISVVMPNTNNPAAPINDNRLTVDGLATISVQPDCFDLHVTFISEHSRADKAVNDVRNQQTKFLEAIKSLSLSNKDMKVGVVSVNPEYDYPVSSLGASLGPKLRGQKASVSMTATLRDFNKIGELLQLATDSGANNISSQFRSSELVKRKAEAREMALKAAKAKAEQTAVTLGFQLGEVVAVQDTPSNPYWAVNEYANNMRLDVPAADTIQAQAQELTISVQVSYRLGQTRS